MTGYNVSYQSKWNYKKNSWFVWVFFFLLSPLPLLGKEKVHSSFFILKFDVLDVSMLSEIFKAWVHPLKVHSESWAFCKETQVLILIW